MQPDMWTTHLIEIRRDDDGERIGYLRSADDGLWEPLNLLGMPLAEPAERDAAESRVRGYSMPSLIEPMWCRIPRPLTQPITDARQVGDDAWWERVVVVESNSTEATIRPWYPMEEEQTNVVSIQLPAHDVLKFREPKGSEIEKGH